MNVYKLIALLFSSRKIVCYLENMPLTKKVLGYVDDFYCY